jgi:hypothetical protein
MAETQEKPNTDAIYSAYFAYLSYKGIPSVTPNEATLTMMIVDILALLEEYGVVYAFPAGAR